MTKKNSSPDEGALRLSEEVLGHDQEHGEAAQALDVGPEVVTPLRRPRGRTGLLTRRHRPGGRRVPGSSTDAVTAEPYPSAAHENGGRPRGIRAATASVPELSILVLSS